MTVFAVEGAAGQRLVDIVEPVGTDKIRVGGDGVKITGIGGTALAFTAGTDEPLPKQTAIGRTELELADQGGFAECMKPRPPIAVVGDRTPVEVEADDVAPAGTGRDRLGDLPGKTAAEVEVVRIVTVQGFGHDAEIRLGEMS